MTFHDFCDACTERHIEVSMRQARTIFNSSSVDGLVDSKEAEELMHKLRKPTMDDFQRLARTVTELDIKLEALLATAGTPMGIQQGADSVRSSPPHRQRHTQ